MAKRVDRVIFKYEADTDKAVKDTDKYAKSIDGVTKKQGGFASAAKAAGGILATIGIAKLGKEMVGLAANMEQTRVAFENFTGSAAKADKLLKQIETFAASTPFQFEELAGTTQKLLAFGVAQEDVMGIVKNLGDVSAGTGKDIQELGAIFGKIVSTGKAQGEELNQLAEAGVPIFSTLAGMFNTTADEVRNMGSRGEITADVITKAFGEMTGEGAIFQDMMQRQSETTAGKLSTMQDNIAKVGREIGEELLPVVNAVADSIIHFLQNLDNYRDSINDFGVEITEALSAFTGPGFANFLTFAPQMSKQSETIERMLQGKLIASFRELGETDEDIRAFSEQMGDLNNFLGANYSETLANVKKAYDDWKASTVEVTTANKGLNKTVGDDGPLPGSIAFLEERIKTLRDEYQKTADATRRQSILPEISEIQKQIEEMEYAAKGIPLIGEEATKSFKEAIDENSAGVKDSFELPIREGIEGAEETWNEFSAGVSEDVKEISADMLVSFQNTFNNVLDIGTQSMDAIYSNIQANQQREFSELARREEEQLKRAGDNEEKRAEIQAKFARQREIMEKAAALKELEYQRLQAIANGARAAVAALPNIPLSIFVGALALGEVSTITSQIQAMRGFKKGGYTGDVGRDDVVGVTHGREFVFDADTTAKNRKFFEMLHKSKGDAMDLLMSPFNPAFRNQYTTTSTGGQVHFEETNKILRRIAKKPVMILDGNYLAGAVSRKVGRTRYLNQKYSL